MKAKNTIKFLCYFLAVLLLLSELGSGVWFLAIFEHAFNFFLIVYMCTTLLTIPLKMPILTIFNTIGFAILAIILFQSISHKPSHNKNIHSDLKIISANLDIKNRDSFAFTNMINEHDPDLFITIELNQFWAGTTKNLNNYPNKLEVIQKNNFGIGVYSKRPLAKQKIHTLSKQKHKALSFEITSENCRYRIMAIHLEPPISSEDIQLRKRQLQMIRELSKTLKINLLIGDFNLTPWSKAFKTFTSVTKFTAPSGYSAFEGTWPAFMPPYLRFPIDHALATPEIEINSVHILRNISSDHRPISTHLTCR